jgi:hypothetical protein
MPYRYPTEFRRRGLDLIAAGRSVASVAADESVPSGREDTHSAVSSIRMLVPLEALHT